MQTFLPYADFASSSAALDDRRLGKQRVETFQILRALTWPEYAWKNHPAVRMWRGFVPALVAYGLANCTEWSRRGYADTVRASLVAFSGGAEVEVGELARRGQLPPWLGLDVLHLSHQSALLRKEPAWYGPIFPGVPDDLPYWWPPSVFPRWPVRRGHTMPDLDGALRVLGHQEPLPGQAEAAQAAASGRDCVAGIRPGFGGSTAGLVAGLMTPGPTLWVTPDDAPRGAYAGAAMEFLPPMRVPAVRRSPAPGPAARAPGPAELAAMAAETERPGWLFFRPFDLASAAEVLARERPGLIAVDRAAGLSSSAAAAISRARDQIGRPPLLAIAGQLSGSQRVKLADSLGMREALHVGGGWDVDSYLEAAVATTPAEHRAAMLTAASERLPALLVTDPGANGAGPLVAALRRRGARVAAVTGATPRPTSARVGAAWRSRRLDVLVVTRDTDLTILGRVRPAALVSGSPPDSSEGWLALVERVRAPYAALVAGAQAPAWARAWGSGSGCLRAGLLADLGQPLAEPCQRCSRDQTPP